MAIRDKTQLSSTKFTNKSPLQNNAHKYKFNPNDYPLVAREDSSSIKSTCIFPGHLNKKHNRMCGKYKQIK